MRLLRNDLGASCPECARRDGAGLIAPPSRLKPRDDGGTGDEPNIIAIRRRGVSRGLPRAGRLRQHRQGHRPAKRADRRLFHDWLVALKADAEKLFANEAGLSREALLTAKAQLYARYQKPPLKPAFKIVDFVDGENWNNASLLGASLYDPDTDEFARANSCTRDQHIGVFLDALRRATEALDDPFKALESLCRT